MIEVTEIDAFTDIGTKKPKITTTQSVNIRAQLYGYFKKSLAPIDH